MAKLKSIGIIGAGQMGTGIAQVCSLAGYDVLLYDVGADRVKSGLATINGNMAKLVGKQALTEEQRKTGLARIKGAETMQALAGCDLVIESATEKEDVKRKIFAELSPLLKSEATIASNTSSISITRLASSTNRPE